MDVWRSKTSSISSSPFTSMLKFRRNTLNLRYCSIASKTVCLFSSRTERVFGPPSSVHITFVQGCPFLSESTHQQVVFPHRLYVVPNEPFIMLRNASMLSTLEKRRPSCFWISNTIAFIFTIKYIICSKEYASSTSLPYSSICR